MPCRAMSIIPLDNEAPINIPMPAMNNTVLKEAAFAPMAEFKKLTASLLTPTMRSNIASTNKKMTMQR